MTIQVLHERGLSNRARYGQEAGLPDLFSRSPGIAWTRTTLDLTLAVQRRVTLEEQQEYSLTGLFSRLLKPSRRNSMIERKTSRENAR